MSKNRRRVARENPEVEQMAARFWTLVRKTRGCWRWKGPARRGGGAGRFSWKGRDWVPHRVAWLLTGRRIPAGSTIGRRCGHPYCVRPDHLLVSGPRTVPRGAALRAVLRRRFWDQVEKSRRGCWLWRGVRDKKGYGGFRVNNQYVPAQRLSWALTRGPVPPGKLVILRCKTKGCVRPAHLKLGERADVHGSVEDRLWGRVKKTRSCWLWQGARLPFGNGLISWQGRSRLVERVVWRLRHGPIPIGRKVFHACSQSACVRPSHLRVGTYSDLQRHLLRKGRHWSQVHPEIHPRGDAHPLRQHPELACRGEDSPRAKLTEAAVRDIRSRIGRSGPTQRSLGAEYGVDQSTIGYAARRRTWKHVE